MAKFILGGAQLGANYGVLSRSLSQRTRRAKSQDTIREAIVLGVGAVDTARSYPLSENLLGELSWPGEIHTKLEEGADPIKSLGLSLAALRRDSVDLVYLFHQLTSWSGYTRKQTEIVVDRLREKSTRIGISVYSAEDARDFHAIELVDVIQLPFNIFAQVDLAQLSHWKDDGKQLIARSVFLQGLLIDTSSLVIPGGLTYFLKSYHQVCQDFGRTPQEMAIGWVLQNPLFDGVVLGAESSAQLRESFWLYSTVRLTPEELEALESIPKPDSTLIDPRNWKIGEIK